MTISARNQLSRSVVDVTPGAVTIVKVRLAGGDVVTSPITKEAADELGLAAGSDVVVLVKASDVILAVEWPAPRRQATDRRSAVARGVFLGPQREQARHRIPPAPAPSAHPASILRTHPAEAVHLRP